MGNTFSSSSDEPKNIRGEMGPQGEMGPRGERGEMGPRGERGEIGPRGERGEMGPIGNPFTYNDFTQSQLASLVGPRGERGEVGPRGERGEMGPKGEMGPIGKPFMYNDFTQSQLASLVGPKGERGEVGPIGPKGDKGDTGLTGLTGLQGPQGPKGDKGDKGDVGSVGPIGPKGEMGPPFDPSKMSFKNLDVQFDGIQDSQSILKLYGINTPTSNYYLMKGGHGQNDNITINALGDIDTKGKVSAGTRVLGTPDGSGNFWTGLRGTASEGDRVAMSIYGDSTTGKVGGVKIPKDFYVGQNPLKFSSEWSGFSDKANNQAEISNDTNAYKQLMLVGNSAGGGPRKVGVWDRLDVHGNLVVDNDTTLGKTVLQNTSTFKVGGKSDTFYPVIFFDNGWNNGQYRLEISRANVHQDNGWRGSMRFICEGHTSNWGHGSDSMDFYYISSNARDNSGNPESFDMFVAKAMNWWAASYIIIWLRGNTSYQWRSITGMSLFDGNPEGVDKQSPNIGTAEKPRYDTWIQTKDIEGRLNLAGKYYDGAKLSGRPSTRFFDGDIEIPSGRHLWIGNKYHGMTYGPEDNFPSAPDGPMIFGYGGGGVGTAQNGNKKVAMTWDLNNDVVARNSMVVQRDLLVNGGMYPLESIKSQPGHNLYIQSDGGSTNMISGNGTYAQMLAKKSDGSDGTSLVVGQGNISMNNVNSVDVNGNLYLKGGSSVHNPNGWQTHFPFLGDNKNYIRGDTELRGNVNNIGDLDVGGKMSVKGDTVVEGNLKVNGSVTSATTSSRTCRDAYTTPVSYGNTFYDFMRAVGSGIPQCDDSENLSTVWLHLSPWRQSEIRWYYKCCKGT